MKPPVLNMSVFQLVGLADEKSRTSAMRGGRTCRGLASVKSLRDSDSPAGQFISVAYKLSTKDRERTILS